MDQLRFELGDSVRQVHHRSAQSENEDIVADHVTDKDVLAHSVEAEPERCFRPLLQEDRALTKARGPCVEVGEILRRDTIAPFLDRVKVDLFNIE